MCLPPEVFNMDYFFNKGLLYTHGKEVCFYEVGGSEVPVKQETTSVEAGAKIGVEKMRQEVGWMRSEIKMVLEGIVTLRGNKKDSVEVEKIRKEVTEVRMEVGRVREEIVALKGCINDLVATSSKHTERIAEGVSLMMMMAKWFRERFPDAPKSLSGPGSGSKSPGPRSVAIPKPPQASKPLTTPSSTRPLIVKKTVPRPSETEKETPESPAKKKAKVTQPSAPPKSGSRGGQTPN
ncbi:uncharacterized protein LOC121801120 [Salvia splendens]|uniref:uncharacterized protein LOC121801120 n=1 Tax=Salvia splendens TaxID=180675 RepID=UPI001C26D440|nr:uncharacterized protein LOC121801120 [Salvia splendens]